MNDRPRVTPRCERPRLAPPPERPRVRVRPRPPRERSRAWRTLLAVGAIDDAAEYITHAPPVPVRELVRRFAPYLRGRRAALAVAVAFASAIPLVEVVEIWLFKIVIDDIVVPHDFAPFPRVAGAYVGLTALTGLLTLVESLLTTSLGQRCVIDLRADVFGHLQTLSPDFFQRRRLGDLVARVTSDTSAIEDFLVTGAQTLCSSLVRLLVVTGALFALDWRLALMSLLAIPPFFAVSRYFSRRLKAVSRERRRRSGAVTVVAEEALRNVALVQAYDRQDWELARFRRANEAKYRAEMHSTRLRGIYTPVVDLAELLGVLIVIGFGTWQLSRGHLTLGGLLVFLTFLSRLYSPVRGVTNLVNSAYSASAGAERVLELLTTAPRVTTKPVAPAAVPAPPLAVELRSVSFRYPGDDGSPAGRPALDHVTVRVGPGEVLAIVGPSGAGKSTIARLLVRAYDPTAGEVLVGGVDVREVALRELHDAMAVVLQETLVFDGTVRDNIAYGRPGASEHDVVAAARAADAHEFITGLPDGYDTRIGERGARLSGGQRQRVALARAMIRDAPILLLDEPTTGLDTASARRLLAPMRRLMSGRTTVVISHNLLTARDATSVLVLRRGRVAGRGSHDELLQTCPPYQQLHRLSGLADVRRPARAAT